MKICIEVYGAMVQNVYAIGNDDVDVTIIDFDLDEDYMETDESIETRHNEFDAFRADPNCRRVW